MDCTPFLPEKRDSSWLAAALRRSGLDDGDPPLAKAYLEPTTRCNLQCRGCLRSSWTETPAEMSMATFDAFVIGAKALRTLQTVAFWGFGEPLLHPELPAMVRRVKACGWRTEVITNGMLLTAELADDLAAAGLDALVVSLDGADAGAHAASHGGADLEVVIPNVERAQAAAARRAGPGLELGIEFVLSRSNLGEFPAVLALARRLGAAFVIATNLLPYNEPMKHEILYFMTAQTHCRPRLVDGAPLVLFPAIDADDEATRLLGDFLPPPRPMDRESWAPPEVAGYCPFVERGAVCVTCDGRVSPCVALMHDHSCYVLGERKAIRACAWGNVRTAPLGASWRHPAYRRFRDRVRRFDFAPCASCGGCELSASNQEDCIGSPFPTCGGCLWAKGVLLCP